MNILNKRTLIGFVVSGFLINFMSQVYAEGISNIVTVAKNGGDYTDPISAMNSIVDASVDNPYLISIAPGTYSLTSPLNVKPFVSITGSGQLNTKLINQTGFFPTLKLQQVMDSTNISIEDTLNNASTISNLTVENSDAGDNGCLAIQVNNDGVGVRLKSLTTIATGCPGNFSIMLGLNGQGVYYAKMDTVTIIAKSVGDQTIGGSVGLFSSDITLDMTGVDILVSGGNSSNDGVWVNSGSANILNSSIRVIAGSVASGAITFSNLDPAQEARLVNSTVDISWGESSGNLAVKAVQMTNASGIIVERSTIKSESIALYADSTSSIKGRSSTIIGAIQGEGNTGIKTCINTGNGDDVELSAACL